MPSPAACPLQIVDLSSCTALSRLDVSSNSLTSLAGLGVNAALRWLSAAGNAVGGGGSGGGLEALAGCERLEVLNLGHNALSGKLSAGRLRALKALILNDNSITLVGGEMVGKAGGHPPCVGLASGMFVPCLPYTLSIIISLMPTTTDFISVTAPPPLLQAWTSAAASTHWC